MKPRIVLVCACLLLGACAVQTPRSSSVTAMTPAATTSVASRPDDNLNAVLWAQRAAEHDLVYLEIYRDAQSKLLRTLHDRTRDALAREDRGNDFRHLQPAVILDVDETVLDNSPFEARMVHEGRAFDEQAWQAWCREQAARALPGALAFTQFAAAHGIRVFYLSNRVHALDQATYANLRALGFPVESDSFLGLGLDVPGCTQAHASDKICRRRLIAKHYRVLMQFGDQLGDFVALGDDTLAARNAAIASYRDWIGQRWFVFPNAMYGSWETALYDNARGLTPEQQRARKFDQLKVQ